MYTQEQLNCYQQWTQHQQGHPTEPLHFLTILMRDFALTKNQAESVYASLRDTVNTV
ncbi:MAG: hypothetical protein ACKVJK_02290 [Methylophagaceae bacterium]